jgi:hypothetical protein
MIRDVGWWQRDGSHPMTHHDVSKSEIYASPMITEWLCVASQDSPIKM